MDNLSNSSLRSSISNRPKQVFIDNEMLDSEYITKAVIYSQGYIIIETPEYIKNKVQGDKKIVVRSMQINDQNINAADLTKTTFMLRALKQRNNFDQNGKQSDIIGYGCYHANINRFVVESQFFEVDSAVPIRMVLYIDDRSGSGFTQYNLPQDNKSFIYYDVQTTYDFV